MWGGVVEGVKTFSFEPRALRDLEILSPERFIPWCCDTHFPVTVILSSQFRPLSQRNLCVLMG